MRLSVILFFVLGLMGCNTTGVFEQTASFESQTWPSAHPINFTCEIKDSLKNYYQIFFVLRHKESYHFSNIWINFSLRNEKELIINNTAQELQLTSNTRWLGTSMGDIIEERIPVTPNPIFLKKGIYQVSITQIMREDPLENILNAGLRVEKIIQ